MRALPLLLCLLLSTGCYFTGKLSDATAAHVSGHKDNEIIEVITCATSRAAGETFTPVRVRVLTFEGVQLDYVLDGPESAPKRVTKGDTAAPGTVPWVWIPDNAGYLRTPRAPQPLPVDLVLERTVRRFQGALRPEEARDAVILIANPVTIGEIAYEVEVYYPHPSTRAKLAPGAELRLGMPDRRVLMRLADDRNYERARFRRNLGNSTLFFLGVPFTFVLDVVTSPVQITYWLVSSEE